MLQSGFLTKYYLPAERCCAWAGGKHASTWRTKPKCARWLRSHMSQGAPQVGGKHAAETTAHLDRRRTASTTVPERVNILIRTENPTILAHPGKKGHNRWGWRETEREREMCVFNYLQLYTPMCNYMQLCIIQNCHCPHYRRVCDIEFKAPRN